MSDYFGAILQRVPGVDPDDLIKSYTGSTFEVIEKDMESVEEFDLESSPYEEDQLLVAVHEKFILFIEAGDPFIHIKGSLNYSKRFKGTFLSYAMNDTAMASEWRLFQKGELIAFAEFVEHNYGIIFQGVDMLSILNDEREISVLSEMGKRLPMLIPDVGKAPWEVEWMTIQLSEEDPEYNSERIYKWEPDTENLRLPEPCEKLHITNRNKYNHFLEVQEAERVRKEAELRLNKLRWEERMKSKGLLAAKEYELARNADPEYDILCIYHQMLRNIKVEILPQIDECKEMQRSREKLVARGQTIPKFSREFLGLRNWPQDKLMKALSLRKAEDEKFHSRNKGIKKPLTEYLTYGLLISEFRRRNAIERGRQEPEERRAGTKSILGILGIVVVVLVILWKIIRII